MKRRLGLVFVLLLLLVCWCSTAMAVENSYGVEIHPVAEDKYTYSVPDGLKATLSKSGNVLNVHVNSAASDWAQLLVNGSANCGLEGTAPAGETVTGCYSLGCSLATKEDTDSAIDFIEWMIAD